MQILTKPETFTESFCKRFEPAYHVIDSEIIHIFQHTAPKIRETRAQHYRDIILWSIATFFVLVNLRPRFLAETALLDKRCGNP